MNAARRAELKDIMRWAEEEMASATFDPFSDAGSRITFAWTDARNELAANPEVEIDPATIGRGTGELPGFRFDLD